MNTITRLRNMCLSLGAATLLGFAPFAQADPVTLELTPSDTVAEDGDPVSLDLVISGLNDGGPDSLGDFDIDITYDISRLLFDSYSLTDLLGDIGLGDALDFSLGDLGGIINLTLLSLLEADDQSCFFCIGPYLDDLQGNSFVLATLNFTVLDLTPGNSTTVSIADINALGDGFGRPLEIAGLNDAIIRNPGDVVGVPEPGTLGLLGLGLLALGIRRRQRFLTA